MSVLGLSSVPLRRLPQGQRHECAHPTRCLQLHVHPARLAVLTLTAGFTVSTTAPSQAPSTCLALSWIPKTMPLGRVSWIHARAHVWPVLADGNHGQLVLTSATSCATGNRRSGTQRVTLCPHTSAASVCWRALDYWVGHGTLVRQTILWSRVVQGDRTSPIYLHGRGLPACQDLHQQCCS